MLSTRETPLSGLVATTFQRHESRYSSDSHQGIVPLITFPLDYSQRPKKGRADKAGVEEQESKKALQEEFKTVFSELALTVTKVAECSYCQKILKLVNLAYIHRDMIRSTAGECIIYSVLFDDIKITNWDVN